MIISNKYMNILNLLSFNGLLLLPLAYIFSSAVVNIIIVIIVSNLLFASFVYKDRSLFKNNFFNTIIIFWIYISIQSFFLENAYIVKSIAYLRFLLLPFAIAYLLNNNLIDSCNKRNMSINAWTVNSESAINY